jgi:hypothetical protein
LDKFDAVRLYGLSINFWQLTLNAAAELINSGNPSSMRYEGWGMPSGEEYEEHMKWSDINIVEPTLFNFYHGIELSLKSLIYAKEIEINNNHKLSNLFDTYKSLYDNQILNSFYEKYIHQDKLPCILKDFCQESDMTMDLYFQSLKYSTSTKGQIFNHSSLRAHGENGVKLFQEIQESLKSVRKEIKQLVLTECKDVIA